MSMNSTDDKRAELNNIMRHQYRTLTPWEKVIMVELKDKGLALVELCDGMGSSRELSLAKTKFEEGVMWAVKHLTK